LKSDSQLVHIKVFIFLKNKRCLFDFSMQRISYSDKSDHRFLICCIITITKARRFRHV
ncbi:hypothetical protein A5875_003875, partial [Enterococcus sp. 3H8_DIV0648]